MTDAPTLKFGKYAGTALPAVPAPYLEFLVKKPDLWPDTRGQIEAELQRRTTPPARPLAEEDAAPLDARLRGDEERTVAARCPRCGHGLTVFVRLTK